VKVVPPGESPIDEHATSPWRTLLIALAVIYLGFWMGFSYMVVIVAVIMMIFMHELGHYLTARWSGMKVSEFFIGFGPRIWSFHRGETEYGVKAIPAGAYVRIIGMSNLEEIDPADEDRTYRAKPYWRRMSVALAGSTMHFLMAFALAFTVFAGFGLANAHASSWTVGNIVKPSAAQTAGLRVGDHIGAVDGRSFSTFQAMSKYLQGRPGADVTLDVVRNGQHQRVDVTLAAHRPNDTARVGFLGVGPTFPKERLSPPSAIARSGREFWTITKMSVTGLGHLVSPKGVSRYVDTLTHPEAATTASDAAAKGRPTSVVGIVEIGGQIARDGWVNVVYLLFAVNVFIGLFNLIPMLPFDGGHAAIATYEKIRSLVSGRRYQADVAKMLPFTYAMVLALAFLFVTSIYLDIAHPVSLR
jgi:membrane-associated protease RseP (regulator of RpoE activity)